MYRIFKVSTAHMVKARRCHVLQYTNHPGQRSTPFDVRIYAQVNDIP
jgi:hypothetical protein